MWHWGGGDSFAITEIKWIKTVLFVLYSHKRDLSKTLHNLNNFKLLTGSVYSTVHPVGSDQLQSEFPLLCCTDIKTDLVCLNTVLQWCCIMGVFTLCDHWDQLYQHCYGSGHNRKLIWVDEMLMEILTHLKINRASPRFFHCSASGISFRRCKSNFDESP